MRFFYINDYGRRFFYLVGLFVSFWADESLLLCVEYSSHDPRGRFLVHIGIA